MWWRMSRNEFARSTYEPNRLALKTLVDGGAVPGVMAYQGGVPVGWVSVAPREDFPSLQRSKILAPVDDQPVWSIVCFYIPRSQRKQGLMLDLCRGALEYARSLGAKIVEVYPMVAEEKMSAMSAYMGIAPVLEKAGFVEVLRRSSHHPIMRCFLD